VKPHLKIKRIERSVFFGIFLVSIFSACSLQQLDRMVNLTFEFKEPEQTPRELGFFEPGTVSMMSTSSIACIGFNVTGPGIGDKSNGGNFPGPEFNNLYSADLSTSSSYCSYPGVIAGPFAFQTTSTTVTLAVPQGTPRLVQAVGIIPNSGSTACTNAWGANGPTSSSGTGGDNADFYEIGRAKLDSLFTDTSVSIQGNASATNNYDPAALGRYKLNCGDRGIQFDQTGPTAVQSIGTTTTACSATAFPTSPYGTTSPGTGVLANYQIFQTASGTYYYSGQDGLANPHECISDGSTSMEMEVYKYIVKSTQDTTGTHLHVHWVGLAGLFHSGASGVTCSSVVSNTTPFDYSHSSVQVYAHTGTGCPGGAGWVSLTATPTGTPGNYQAVDEILSNYPASCFVDGSNNIYVGISTGLQYTSECARIATDDVRIWLQ